ncbi:MAG: ATPase [Acidobacteria bacterium]|nr:MAG: ATPase [Acidobacteriota bacterium]
MANPELVYVIYIATSPDRLWAALTRGELTKQYWYGRRLESDWTVGSPVRFYDRDTQNVSDSGEVLEYQPPVRLGYTFRNEYIPDARALGYSRVGFTIEHHEGMVKLTLVHDQLPNEDWVTGFREGWAAILSSLKTFLETGKSLPPVKSMEERARVPEARPSEP